MSDLDITEPRKTEEALRRYLQRLETLHEMDLAILSGLSAEIMARATDQPI